MSNQLRCPHCGKTQLPIIRVQTMEPSADGAAGKDDPRKTLRVALVLLLSLTIIGLPIAYWLCQRFDKEYPVRTEPLVKYSYRCSLCGYAWTWRTDEPLPQCPPRNSTQGGDDKKTLPTTPQETVQHSSFLREVVAWWFRV